MFFQNFSEDLSNLFKKTFQLQKALMELIEKVLLDNNSDAEEVKEMTGVCHDLLHISILIGDIDVGLLVNTWKALIRLVTKHKAIIKNDLHLERFISHLCESIKSKMMKCLSMAEVKEGQSTDDIELMNSIEAKSFSKMVRVVRFLMGILMQIVKEYCDMLCGTVSELLTLLISLYSSVPPSLSAPSIIPSSLPEISASVLVMIQPLLKVLIINKSFAKCLTKKAFIIDRSVNGYGQCRVLLDIAAILPGQPDGVLNLWMNPTNFPEEEPCFTLLHAVMEVLKKCVLETNLPVYVDGIMCAGKPARSVSFYEYAVTHLSALIACSPASCFHLVEKCLLECLLGREFLSTLMAIDLWTFMARWESADLCSKHVHFLLTLVNHLPFGSPTHTNVSMLVRRLACLMAKDHQEKLLVSFPPSKSEHLLLWSVLPVKAFPENVQSKVCRVAVPVCIKQCNNNLHDMLPALCCLKSIYRIDDVKRLVPPVHHAAVIDIITSTWSKFNQQTFQPTEDVWLEIIELAGILLPYIQPDHYAKILRCLDNLLNQFKSVELKVAIAQFLGKCGTKEVLPDSEIGVFGAISGLFSSLVSDESWLVYQISLQSVKAFAEVTPYTHIMGDCVPERLLPSLSDFLSNVPYKQQELSPNKIVWLGDLLRCQIQDKEVGTNSKQSDICTALDELAVSNTLEPDRKRMKCDDNSQDNPHYTKILLAIRSQVDDLYHLRTKYSPNEAVMKDLQDIHTKLTNFIETAKVSHNVSK
ncbi:Uncharacterized protein C1orf112-like [Exaiptasia diaphana]|nr:Uncharacterized protein C1orf112-like [Exaiptasia diaphana]